MHAHGNTASARPDFHGSCANHHHQCNFGMDFACLVPSAVRHTDSQGFGIR